MFGEKTKGFLCLQDLAAKRHQEFVGNGQHDAQELLNIILDAIHEDLNRVISKPLVPPVEDQNRPDQVEQKRYSSNIFFCHQKTSFRSLPMNFGKVI